MSEIDKDKVVMALRCNLNFSNHADCSECAYSCSKSTHISVQANLLADALALIEKQAEQLAEWEKYTGFLYAHGFFRDKTESEPVMPVSVTMGCVMYDADTGKRVATKKVTNYDGRQKEAHNPCANGRRHGTHSRDARR